MREILGAILLVVVIFEVLMLAYPDAISQTLKLIADSFLRLLEIEPGA